MNIDRSKSVKCIKDTFIYYIKVLGGNKEKLTYVESIALYNFVDFLYEEKIQIGPSFIFDYFNYQFEYFNWQLKEGNRKVPLGKVEITFIIGKKAWLRWTKKIVNYKWFVEKNLLKDYKIASKSINKIFNDDKIIYLFNELEKERRRFYNKPIGFTHCLSSGLVYEEINGYCKECIFREKCKKL